MIRGPAFAGFCILDIYSAAHYMKVGYRIRRQSWSHMYLDSNSGSGFFFKLNLSDLLANDWEVITQGITKYFPITY